MKRNDSLDGAIVKGEDPSRIEVLTDLQRRQIYQLAEAVAVAGMPLEKVQSLADDLIAEATTFRSRRVRIDSPGYDAELRTRKKLLNELVDVCERLLPDRGARIHLYTVPELDAATDHPFEHLQTMLAEKSLAEGAPLATFTLRPDADLDLEAMAEYHLLKAVRPGAWVRDAARDLRGAAQIALSKPPYRRDKIDDTLDQLIQGAAMAWMRATDSPPLHKRRRGEPGRQRSAFVDVLRVLLEILGEPPKEVTEQGLMARIRHALDRESRGFLFSR